MAVSADKTSHTHGADYVARLVADVDALKGELARLQNSHAAEIRRLEIAFLRSEFAFAVKIRQINARVEHADFDMSAEAPLPRRSAEAEAQQTERRRPILYDERSPLGRLLFRKDGRPKKPLRLLLFAPSGRPRSLTWKSVFHKDGRPRRRYLEWMQSEDYQRLPQAHRI